MRSFLQFKLFILIPFPPVVNLFILLWERTPVEKPDLSPNTHAAWDSCFNAFG